MITTKTNRPSLAAVVRGDEVQVGSSVIGLASAQTLSLKNGGAVGLLARESAELTNGYSQWMLAGENASVTNGGAGALVAGGQMSVTNGGGALILAGNGVAAERVGAGAIVTGKAEIQGGYVGMVVSGKTTVGEGAKILLGTREAIVFGVVVALLLRLFGVGGQTRRRRRRVS